MTFNKNNTNNDYVTNWTRCVNLGIRDTRFFLSLFVRRIMNNPAMYISLRHRPLLKRLLGREPRIVEGYDADGGSHAFEEVVFFVNREGLIVDDSFVKRTERYYCSPYNSQKLEKGEDIEGESLYDVFRRINRREIGAVVMAVYNPDKFGDKWMVTVYHAPQDPEELVRWNREFSNPLVDKSMKRQVHKAGRRRH